MSRDLRSRDECGSWRLSMKHSESRSWVSSSLNSVILPSFNFCGSNHGWLYKKSDTKSKGMESIFSVQSFNEGIFLAPFIAILVAKDFRNKIVFSICVVMKKDISTTWPIINLVIFRVETKESSSKDNMLYAPCQGWYRIFALTFWKHPRPSGELCFSIRVWFCWEQKEKIILCQVFLSF